MLSAVALVRFSATFQTKIPTAADSAIATSRRGCRAHGQTATRIMLEMTTEPTMTYRISVIENDHAYRGSLSKQDTLCATYQHQRSHPVGGVRQDCKTAQLMVVAIVRGECAAESRALDRSAGLPAG